MKPKNRTRGWSPEATLIRNQLIDAECSQAFPDLLALIRHVAERHKRDAYDVATVVLFWKLTDDLWTPAPPEWRASTLAERRKLLNRIKRTQALD